MLTKEQLEKYAKVMVWGMEKARSSSGGKFKRGDVVLVTYEKKSVELAESVYRECLRKGYHVTMHMGVSVQMEKDFFNLALDEQIQFLGSWNEELYKNINGRINLISPESLTHLKETNPQKIAMRGKSVKPLRDIMLKRELVGDFGWTLCMVPTEAMAEQAKMTLEDYEKEVIKSCYLDEDDPVAIWEKMYEDAQKIKDWLNAMDIDYYHVESENTDLKIGLGQDRQWLGLSGHNIPSFELFTSPDWRLIEGTYFANMPSLRSGNYVEGVKLLFKKGSAVEISAKIGNEFVKQQLGMDENANKVGEFSLTDNRFSKIDKFMADTLYDENAGGKEGNCHIAVGTSYPESYSGDEKNNSKLQEKLGFNNSALHWDLVNTEKKKVTAYIKNGMSEVIYENGRFTFKNL